MQPHKSIYRRILSLILVAALFVTPLALCSTANTQASQNSAPELTTTTEYQNYVHNFVGPLGNTTYIEKPMFPVQFSPNQIPIGQNWTIICPLTAGHSYHIYFYGAYINTSCVAKTDYDVYVYDPQMELESTHTQSAGLPEHLGTNVSVPLFTPTETGNWTFVINNNPVDSRSAQEATFMIIEDLQPNQWYTTPIQSPNGGNATFYSNWAYEFETNSSYVELYVKVPNTLDMYEARLYLMNNAQSPTLDNFPLPWESGLYGNLSGSVGGYNFEPNSYRGVAYASCEYMGESMFLNYTSPNEGANLYQLVLMGEIGSGDVTFLLKTDFENQTLTPLNLPDKVVPGNATEISYSAGNDTLTSAELSYTVNNWNSTSTVDMQVDNATCSGTIPAEKLGANVQYMVNATDILENNLEASGNYTVKEPAELDIAIAKGKVMLGQEVAVTGTLTPSSNGDLVDVRFATADCVKIINCTVDDTGAFTAEWKPNSVGNWTVSAISPESPLAFAGYSQNAVVTITPAPLYIRYSLYLLIGFVALVVAGSVYYFISSRRS